MVWFTTRFMGPVDLTPATAEASPGPGAGMVLPSAPSIAADLAAIQGAGDAEFSLGIETTPVPAPVFETPVPDDVLEDLEAPIGEVGQAEPADVWAGLGLAVDGIRSGSRQAVTVRVTHYWPPLGGTNCYAFRDGLCVSAMFSGAPWEPYVGIAAACPWDWKVGNAVAINGRLFLCLDRGAMVCEDGVCHVDILTDRLVDGIYPAERWY